MHELIFKASDFAKNAHDSIQHKRKYTNEPYWVHPERVANIVAEVTDDAAIIAAAWLHDVIEDVAPLNENYNAVAILHEFGEQVLQLVLEVTDVSKPEDGNRCTRKAIDRAHLAKASKQGKLIKLADLIDNALDISQHDPGFAKVFKKEVALDLPYLRLGNEKLFNRLQILIQTDQHRFIP
jgi:(p)ppGpp synthase/HD superfamily hydrolase